MSIIEPYCQSSDVTSVTEIICSFKSRAIVATCLPLRSRATHTCGLGVANLMHLLLRQTSTAVQTSNSFASSPGTNFIVWTVFYLMIFIEKLWLKLEQENLHCITSLLISLSVSACHGSKINVAFNIKCDAYYRLFCVLLNLIYS